MVLPVFVNRSKNCTGFTLVEVSLVLVIIALLVGGTLIGQELIEGAKIRSQIAQLEKISTAIKTFRLKYNAIPGDMLDADKFGLPYTGVNTTNRGNGIIDNFASTAHPVSNLWLEAYYIFIHLSAARLIEGNYNWQAATYNYCEVSGANMQFPKLKVGDGGIYGMSYKGDMWLGLMMNVCPSIAGDVANFSTGGVMKPIHAYSIDTKLDDGIPGTGNVFAATNYLGAVDVNVAQCVVDGTATVYNVNDSDLQCRLFVRVQ